ncbi:TolC family protein [Hymenobacter profundi]|uniref:TolC family protein n=1 Tax=Hymenobacter profundi TaxID=1982110 RepID=A0ABS6X129_9BACT|nr:TolC family protein [Hymenobacter profundi]MBW3129537.1 TolC family protein [Hymenobacter profundi]
MFSVTRFCFSLTSCFLLTGAAVAQQLPKPEAKPQTEKPATVVPAPPLSLEEALRMGLQSNYGILISRRDEEIASNNVTRGNAGQLPVVSGNALRTFNINNSRQQLNNNDPRVVRGGKANALAANANLNWTIFDGLGMFIALDRLRTLEQFQREVTRNTVEQTIADITDAYYAVVRESGKIKSLEEALNIGQARIDLTQAQVDVGLTAKVNLLTAQVDFNADRSLLIQQQELLATSKINLNNLLSRAPNVDFQPTDSIVITRGLNHDAIAQAVRQRNPRLQQAQLNTDVATYDRRLIRASRYPTLALTGTYGLTRNINNAIFINTPDGSFLGSNVSRVYGPSYGVQASIPIFDGFNRTRLEQNARVTELQTKLQLNQTQLQLDAELEQAYVRYQNRLQLLQLEEDNIKLARQNVAIALERYRLGLLTPLDLRVAQNTQLAAEVRLLDIRYDAKQAETALRRLSSGLVQEQ